MLALMMGVALVANGAPASAAAAPAPTTAPAASPRDVDPAVAAFLQPIEAAQGDDALRAKLKERHNTAVRLLQAHIDRYRSGIADLSAVFESAQEVAAAKMVLAQNAGERADVARHVVEATRAVESRLEKQVQAGVGLEVNLLRARLARENAEIELLSLQQQSSATAPTTQTTQPR